MTGPLDAVVDEIATHMQRTGIRLALDLAEDVRAAPNVREGLIRIACEAVNNAANHSGADLVRVELVNGERLQLLVVQAALVGGHDPGEVGLSELPLRIEHGVQPLAARLEFGLGKAQEESPRLPGLDIDAGFALVRQCF